MLTLSPRAVKSAEAPLAVMIEPTQAVPVWIPTPTGTQGPPGSA